MIIVYIIGAWLLLALTTAMVFGRWARNADKAARQREDFALRNEALNRISRGNWDYPRRVHVEEIVRRDNR